MAFFLPTFRRISEAKQRGVEKIKQMNEYKAKAMKNEEERVSLICLFWLVGEHAHAAS